MISSARSQGLLRVVVAALAAVLLGLVEAEEAELGEVPTLLLERGLGNVVSSHSSAWGGELLLGEAADRLPQLLVLVGEDEVLARKPRSRA